MNANAIVYTSNTGYTAQYARLLGEKTGPPVYSLAEAGAKLPAGNCVIYLGWLMAGKVQGYAKAAKRYRVAAVCGVGMGATGSQLADVRKANSLGNDLPLFTLQGGFDMGKLKDYQFWFADYEEIPQTPYDFVFWQYTAYGKVNGISTIVDRDIMFVPVIDNGK